MIQDILQYHAKCHVSQKQGPGDPDVRDYIADTPQNSCSIGYLHITRIFQARLGPGSASTLPDVAGFTIQTFSRNFIVESIAKLDDEIKSLVMDSIPSSAEKISFWIPESILLAASPGLVKKFKGKRSVAPMYPLVCYLREGGTRNNLCIS